MPIAPTRNTTSLLILVAIALFGLIVGYFYYSQALQDQVIPISPIDISADDGLAKFKDLKLDFSVLDGLAFKALRIFGESPVQPGSTGRADPFAPF
ncbi:MAG: hypothetical protein HYX20_01070 [Candidatus Yanofskybacteria bacterium]|nr:hypothetical protein [Candidatus Yanofskybacteria bacterium]